MYKIIDSIEWYEIFFEFWFDNIYYTNQQTYKDSMMTITHIIVQCWTIGLVFSEIICTKLN